jgi:hypothetical protein
VSANKEALNRFFDTFLEIADMNCRTWFVALCIGCLIGAGALGCGDEGGASNNGGGNNGTASNNGGSNNGNSTSESSFDATAESDDGTEDYSNKQDDSQAGEGTWGAAIAGSTLQITLASSDGTAITAYVETSESNKAPGGFTPQGSEAGTFVTLLSATEGNAYTSGGQGTVTLDSCPRAVGERAKGSFDGVVLSSDVGNATKTLSGDFDVVVYAKAGDLFCEEEDTNDNNGNNDTGGQCGADWCEGGGVCCPYVDCISQCEFECLTQDADCQGGLNPAACAQCANACLDECDVDQACRTEIGELNTCGANSGCDDTETSEAEQQCLEQNCCSQVKATF